MFDPVQIGDYLLDWVLLAFLGLYVGLALVYLRAVYEVCTMSFRKDKDKFLWLSIAGLFFPIGPIIYFIKRKDLLARPQVPGK